MILSYDINKIKFATDEATFKRAVGLYESGKVTEVETLGEYYSAVVMGSRMVHLISGLRSQFV